MLNGAARIDPSRARAKEAFATERRLPTLSARLDDELWELVPEDAKPPVHLVRFVRSLGEVGRALDLGCGDGRLTAELDARELTIADVSSVALSRARRRLPHATAVELEIDAPLPLRDSRFDFVLCTETIEHVRDTQLFLSEVRRVLTPAGKLALSTPAHRRATALSMLVRGFEPHFDPLSPHLRFFTARSLEQLLERMGFEPLSRETRGGSLLVVAGR